MSSLVLFCDHRFFLISFKIRSELIKSSHGHPNVAAMTDRLCVGKSQQLQQAQHQSDEKESPMQVSVLICMHLCVESTGMPA